jgi:hypothetical protein
MGKILLLQLFWVSFVLIGLVALFLCSKRFHSIKHSQFTKFMRQTHPLCALLISFAAGVSLFLPFIVPAYIFELPIWVVEGPYIAMLLAACTIAVYHRKKVLIYIVTHSKLDRKSALITFVLILALGTDFVLTMHVKGLLIWDAPVHIARVNYILAHQKFALADPYFGNHGVVDPRYSTNLLLGLQAVAADLLHVSAVKVWYYSYSFFRLIAWLGLFALAWNFLGNKERTKWSYIILGLSPFIYNLYFRFVEFPDRIVLVWVILFIIGLKLWLEKGSWLLLFLACGLIAATHPVNALMGIGFLGLLGFVLLIRMSVTKQQVLILLSCCAILILPVLPNLYYPNRTAVSERAFTASAISGSNPDVQHYGPFLISRLPLFSPVTISVLGLLVICIYLVNKKKSAPARVVIYLLAVCTALLVYDPRYVSLLGYGYLLIRTTNSGVRLLLGLLIIYYGLLIYNPVFWHFVQNKIPPWVIARFQEFNVIGLVALLFGWLVVIEMPALLWGYRRVSAFLYVAAPLVYLLILPHLYVMPLPLTVLSLQDSDNAYRHKVDVTLSKLQPYLKGQIVYADDQDFTFMLPSIIKQTNTINTLDTNYSPMAHIMLRDHCYESLRSNLSLADLKAAGVTRILINTAHTDNVDRQATTLPYLTFMTEENGVKVYAVQSSNNLISNTSSVCAIPDRQ